MTQRPGGIDLAGAGNPAPTHKNPLKDVIKVTGITFIIAASLLGVVAGILAVLVISIRREDRAMTLTSRPHSGVEAATRHLLGVGTRRPQSDEDEEA
jgi:hypothetical protein